MESSEEAIVKENELGKVYLYKGKITPIRT